MKLINQSNAALILLLHAFLIPIGMIAAYLIPSSEDPTVYFNFPFYDLKEQSHSTAELQSWLNFLESPHEETFVGKETISETLDKNEALGALKFFSNVAEGDHVDYLADRISAREDEGHPYLWRITLQGASDEEASTLFNALTTVIKRKFLDQVAAYDTPIDILPGEYHMCVIFDDAGDKKLKCFGRNSSGQLGYGDTNHRSDKNEFGSNLPFVDLGTGRTVKKVSLFNNFC